jgi:hypothetical protein
MNIFENAEGEKLTMGPKVRLLIILSQFYIYGELITGRAPQKFDPIRLKFEFPKIVKVKLGPSKF